MQVGYPLVPQQRERVNLCGWTESTSLGPRAPCESLKLSCSRNALDLRDHTKLSREALDGVPNRLCPSVALGGNFEVPKGKSGIDTSCKQEANPQGSAMLDGEEALGRSGARRLEVFPHTEDFVRSVNDSLEAGPPHPPPLQIRGQR